MDVVATLRGRPKGTRIPIAQRFWAKVDKRAPDECWEWTGARFQSGYGSILRGGRGSGCARAHRVSYEMNVGPVPSGMHVLHRCDNPRCVNPGHLWLGTHADNMADRRAKGRY